MKLRKIFFVVLVAFALLGFATFSHAACTMYGKVAMVASGGGSVTYYIAPNTTLPTYYVYFYTSNQILINVLNGAQQANLKVNITGNAASCPTTTGAGGQISTVYRYTNY